MAKLLYLVHRTPYPPNKGDKVRSYHLLRHLAARHQVYLGTFVDDPADWAHVPTLQKWCAEVKALPLDPLPAKLRSLWALVAGGPLSTRVYHSAELHAWVKGLLQRESIDAAVVFSSSMAPYALQHLPGDRVLLDLVDVDSAKWAEYGRRHRGPLGWLYAREGRELLAYERQAVQAARRSFLVTQKECELFAQLAPQAASRVEPVGNGVDAEHFSPQAERPSPYPAGQVPVAFTGAMDYWPNADAVVWFAREVLPAQRQRHPALHFWIVGRGPGAEVKALAGEGVTVTGAVEDVRPYLQHAAVVVAPLRLARGIQNKVLEAMAMARPVVAARTCAEAMTVKVPHELRVADSAEDYVREVTALLADAASARATANAARERVLQAYSWDAHLAAVDAWLPSACLRPDAVRVAETLA